MKILKISFDLINTWKREDFRKFIKLIQTDKDKRFDFDLYIISEKSTDDNINDEYINSVGDSLDLYSTKIIICDDLNEKLDALDDNGIDIHFDSLQSNIDFINEESLDTVPILVDYRVNRLASNERDSTPKMFYVKLFEEELNNIENGES